MKTIVILLLLVSNASTPQFSSDVIELHFDKCPRSVKAATVSACAEWESAIGHSIKFVVTKADTGNGVYVHMPHEWPFPENTFSPAATVKQAVGDNRADIYLNWNSFNFHRGLPVIADDTHISLDFVLMHEIGHALGLGHNPDPDSIMYAQIHSVIDNADSETVKRMYPKK